MPRHAEGRATDPRTARTPARLLALVGAAAACLVAALPPTMLPASGGPSGPSGEAGRWGRPAAGPASPDAPAASRGASGTTAAREALGGGAGGGRVREAAGPRGAGSGGGAAGDVTPGASAHGTARTAPGTRGAWGGARSPDGGTLAGQRVDDGSAGDRGPVASGAVHAPGGRAGSTSPDASAFPVLRCGPEVSSPEGIEAQTCLVARGDEIRGRTYYRNATGTALSAILVLIAPDGSSVRVHCAMEPDDEPAVCETPRRLRRGDLGDHEAVTEFAGRAGHGPLLLRSGSNPPGD